MYNVAVGAFVIIIINGWNGTIIGFPMMVAYPLSVLKD
jgi:hypothetical protein